VLTLGSQSVAPSLEDGGRIAASAGSSASALAPVTAAPLERYGAGRFDADLFAQSVRAGVPERCPITDRAPAVVSAGPEASIGGGQGLGPIAPEIARVALECLVRQQADKCASNITRLER
jgi:hypothetical protein